MTALEREVNQNAERRPEKGRVRRILEWVSLTVVFVMVHVWAMAMLWLHGPVNRQGILVVVYSGALVGSALLTKRLPPPLAPSLVLFGVVAAWWMWWI